MYAAIRSPLMTATALATAGVIAVSPISPQVSDLQLPSVRTAQVQLSAALIDPIPLIAAQLQAALDQTAAMAAAELADPLPAIRQLLTNQVTTVSTLGTAVITSAGATGSFLFNLPGAVGDAVKAVFDGDLTVGQAIQLLGSSVGALGSFVGTTLLRAVDEVGQGTGRRAGAVLVALGRTVPTMLASALNVPIALAQSIVRAGINVARAVFTLDPSNVVNAITEGVLGADGITISTGTAVNNFFAASQAVRDGVTTALEIPNPTLAAGASVADVPTEGAQTFALRTVAADPEAQAASDDVVEVASAKKVTHTPAVAVAEEEGTDDVSATSDDEASDEAAAAKDDAESEAAAAKDDAESAASSAKSDGDDDSSSAAAPADDKDSSGGSAQDNKSDTSKNDSSGSSSDSE
ncbi:MAG: hypothetical protein HYZ38_19075 [Mycobacterium sp.]|nr:hypothetical protein [Mycobacterium sp.]